MKVKVCVELDKNVYDGLMEIVETGNKKFNDNMTLEEFISMILTAIALNKHIFLDLIEHGKPPYAFAG